MSQATQKKYDVLVIGAGAAGLMCAIEAGKRGRKVWLIDHSEKTAEKIRISGGGRANFTNLDTRPEAFLSQNKHFCKSALSQYTQHDFIALVEKHDIAYHEKKLGQLFCDDSAQQIIDMLLDECADAGVKIDMSTAVEHIGYKNEIYSVQTTQGAVDVESVVVATGGLSIPKIGATKFGYTVAEQFGLNMIAPCAGLVPLTFTSEILDLCKNISGLSVDAEVKCGKISFAEGLLFTHRGLSGPSILQISSYWQGGQTIEINLAPSIDVDVFLKEKQATNPKQDVCNSLSEIIPKRLAESICVRCNVSGNVAEVSNKDIALLKQNINTWTVKPNGTEGYRTAEVTTGGVDTNELSSKTMEAKKQPGLFFIGEVVDVTGHLGGYNFQWAWSSGYVAGQYA
tara:strand:+ start:366023 stop:367216 length:1194 start_codon:yes stop_codon:yes gene_type:complete